MLTIQPCPQEPHPHIFRTLPGMVPPSLSWEVYFNALQPFKSMIFFFPNI